MKCDVLEEYRFFLEKRRRPATARVYTERLNTLLKGQSIINTMENLDIDKMISNMDKAKNKNEFSQYKNALLYFLDFENIVLSKQQLEIINDFEKSKKKKYRKQQMSDFQKVDKTIKHLKNKKLKLSYQTILETGTRVSELSQITKNNCTFSADTLTMRFIGKGGRQEQVILSKEDNKKLFSDLTEMIQNTRDTKKVFYSANYLQQKAKKYKFTCHDLRRAYAKLEYQKTKSKEDVREKLRHTNIKTTERYLKSQVNIK